MNTKLSHEEIRDLVLTAIRRLLPSGQSAYSRDVYGGPESGTIVYWTEDSSGLVPGGYYEVAWTMDANQNVSLGDPVAVRPATSYVPVKYSIAPFALPKARRSGGLIVVPAKIFEIGDYPDKDFSMSIADFDERMLPGFKPVPILIEHIETPLTNKDEFNMGCIRRIWRQGSSVFGEIVFKSWVGEAFSGQAPKLSVSIDRASMKLTECSIVEHPRVEDAALLETFAKQAQRSGQSMNITDLFRKWMQELIPVHRQAEFNADTAATATATAQLMPTPLISPPTPGPAPLEFSHAENALIAALTEKFAASLAGIVPAAKLDGAKALYADLMRSESAKFGADSTLQETKAARSLRELLSALPSVAAEIDKEVLGGATRMAGDEVEKPKAPLIDERGQYDRFSGAKNGGN